MNDTQKAQEWWATLSLEEQTALVNKHTTTFGVPTIGYLWKKHGQPDPVGKTGITLITNEVDLGKSFEKLKRQLKISSTPVNNGEDAAFLLGLLQGAVKLHLAECTGDLSYLDEPIKEVGARPIPHPDPNDDLPPTLFTQ